MKLIPAALLCLLLIGCATHTTHGIRNAVDELRPGMTTGDVLAKMGKPGNSQFDGDKEVWQYRSFGMVETDHVILTFTKGRLTGKKSASGTFHHNYLQMSEL